MSRSPQTDYAAPRRGESVWGLLDQGLVSGVNFFTIVLLARSLAPEPFGYFVLAFTVLQSAGTLQSALVTRPHNVLGAVRRGRDYADFSAATAAAQAAFSGLLTVAALIAALGVALAGSPRAGLVAATAPALLAWQLQELGRRMLYTENRLRAACANDALAYGGQTAALVVLWRLDLLTGTRALLTLAAAFAVAAALLAWQLRGTLAGSVRRVDLTAAWGFGKWLGVAEVAQWLSTQLYVYLAAAVVGPVASGAIKAGQTLLGPMSVFLTFVTSYLPIVLTRELEATGSIAGKLRESMTRVLPLVVCYCAAMALIASPALRAVYGPAYRPYADVVQLFALYYVLLAFSTVAVAALSALRATRAVFVGQAAGAVVSLAVGWLLLDAWGPAGGVAGMLVSWAAAMALFLHGLRHALRLPALRPRPRADQA